MIDTDKYERMLKDETYRLDGRNNMMALKLLAEVKRLHEEITYIVNGIGQVASDAFSRMVIEDLRKVIE